jgi:hypothetical protein
MVPFVLEFRLVHRAESDKPTDAPQSWLDRTVIEGHIP